MAIHIGRREFIVELGGAATAWQLAAAQENAGKFETANSLSKAYPA
jgi:hypothetical protein